MLSVSLVIPAWNEAERIEDCLTCCVRQTMPAKEIIVVDNKSTDNTRQIVQRFIDAHPESNIILMEQDAEQGLIPTRNYGLDHATGDVLGRFDADCMLKPDWVEVVSGVFTEDPDAMGCTGPVAYYDMPARRFGLKGDNKIRKHIYRADGNHPLLFGSNMALRATAWKRIRTEVCRDKADVMHEDIDVSLHLIGDGLKTVYCPRMIAAMSARRIDSSLPSFLAYMDRFKNTFNAHPRHWRLHKPEITFRALYPMLHLFYPQYQLFLKMADVDPAERMWLGEQMKLMDAEESSEGASWVPAQRHDGGGSTAEGAASSTEVGADAGTDADADAVPHDAE
ncbi:MAG: glycosyltransferase family A protein [Bifidobacteriaceae bacterium]|nr:glycosyltransferase family A protein [Bifidobacteriaceae bacterium]